jgi:hypothetical protein
MYHFCLSVYLSFLVALLFNILIHTMIKYFVINYLTFLVLLLLKYEFLEENVSSNKADRRLNDLFSFLNMLTRFYINLRTIVTKTMHVI